MAVTVTLQIPSIGDSQPDFNKLFNIYRIVEESLAQNTGSIDYFYDFSGCRTLYPNAIAFLFGLFRYIRTKNQNVYYIADSLKFDLQNKLMQHGFLQRIDNQIISNADSTYILLRNDFHKPDDSYEPIINFLKNSWLQKEWIHLSDLVKNAIAGTVLEIYDNSFCHSFSQIGTFSCGEKIDDRVKLSIIDFGRSIPSNVISFLKDNEMSSSQALKWAFDPGHTTVQGNRGMGLDLLKSFVKLNKGELEIFSGTGHAKINEKDDLFTTKQICFSGTLIYITFMCDNKYYQFANEAQESQPAPLF
jgi:hypothetical protein